MWIGSDRHKQSISHMINSIDLYYCSSPAMMRRECVPVAQNKAKNTAFSLAMPLIMQNARSFLFLFCCVPSMRWFFNGKPFPIAISFRVCLWCSDKLNNFFSFLLHKSVLLFHREMRRKIAQKKYFSRLSSSSLAARCVSVCQNTLLTF